MATNKKNKKNSYKKKKTIQTNNKKVSQTNKNVVKKEPKQIKQKKEIITETLNDDKKYKEAEKLYKNNEFDLAIELYISLLEKYPKNKRIYKRLIDCLTHNYTFKDNSKEFKMKLDDYITTYRLLANKKDLKYFEHKLEEYRHVRISTSKSKFLITALLGYFGIHKFLEKKYIMGIIYLFTLGFFGIGVIVDLINDYAEYEDDLQLDIFRYIISLLILIFGLIRSGIDNFYYFIIIAIIFTPIIYSKVLKILPGIIKVVIIIILGYLGFKDTPVINYVPTSILGKWVTKNENTNFSELNITLDKTTIKFNDRDKEIGKNEYDDRNKILTIIKDENTYYKFQLNLDEEKICVYTESNKCIVGFEKDK